MNKNTGLGFLPYIESSNAAIFSGEGLFCLEGTSFLPILRAIEATASFALH